MKTSRVASAEETGARSAPLRVAVLGAGGQLGRCLVRAVEAQAGELESVAAPTHQELDLTDAGARRAWLDAKASEGLDLVINAAAFTKVDACESESAVAYAVNSEAPAAWAADLARGNIRFFHVSTDYVFSGDGTVPYQESDPTAPTTVYGASKLAGEEGVLAAMPEALIVRTSWVFGPGRNFVRAILDQAEKRRTGEVEGPLLVVDDQLGSPTYAADLASALLNVATSDDERLRDVAGLLHLRNGGETTWFDFARQILQEAGYASVAIEPVATAAFPTEAPRPSYSVLDCSRAKDLGLSMPSWNSALSSYLSGPDRPPHLRPDGTDHVTGSFPGHEGRA